MSETIDPNRGKTSDLSTNGSFKGVPHSEVESGTNNLSVDESEVDFDQRLDLPNGVSIKIEETPDLEAFTPMVKELDDGNYQVTYVTSEGSPPTSDPLGDHGQFLRTYDIQVHSDVHENPRNVLREYCASGENDLDRAMTLHRIQDDPPRYEGRIVGNGFYADDGDDDDWKMADGVMIFPADRAPEEFDGWVDELNSACKGRTYAVQGELRAADGSLLEQEMDDYDGTIVDAGDAADRASSYHSGDLGPFFE